MAISKMIFDNREWIDKSKYLPNLIGKQLQNTIRKISSYEFLHGPLSRPFRINPETIDRDSYIDGLVIWNNRLMVSFDCMGSHTNPSYFYYDEIIKMGGTQVAHYIKAFAVFSLLC